MKIATKFLALTFVVTASALAAADDSAPINPDPWESFNRKVFAFNDFLDRNFLKPVAKGYEAVTPQFVENGVHQMFSNIGEIGNFLNSLLQAKLKNTAESGGRFVVNSTIGLLGFFDVASKMGMLPHEEDFGQTLGYWGVRPGPYLVVPFLGPRTVRDGFGSIADAYTDPVTEAIDHVPTRNEVLGGRVIDSRAQLLKAEELVTGDRYIFIRDAYLQRRQFLINDGAVKDTFGDDDFMYDEPAGGNGSAGKKDTLPGGSAQPESE
ncbi:MAG TPA: VacJ family lipoprotein [Spongiibacteraceae bacterium]|nr:VacJ family lipoprotein [Spongiibacteraceae bacterium]